MRRGGQGAGPGVADTHEAKQAAPIVRLHGECDACLGRGTPPQVVQVLWVAVDEVVERWGPSQAHMTGGPGPPCLPPRCQPHLGVLLVARGTTPMAAGVVGLVRLSAVITRPQLATQGLGPAVHTILHGPAMAGPVIRAKPHLIGGPRGPEDVCPLGPARAPQH
jgi:hypothetical protein